jgi:hypothetical protein
MADYSDPLGLLFGGVDYFGSPQKSKGLLQLTPQEIERMAAAQSPAFGVFPQMQPYRSQQDITASANVPVDVARGRVAGTLGLFGDVFNQPIPMVRPLQLLSQAMTGQQKYPDTEYFLENLPLKSDTPIGDVAGRIGSFAPINPMPAVRGAQKLGGLLGEEMATRLNTGKPLLPSLLAEPQTAMFAVNPAEQAMTSGLLQAEVSPLGFYSAVEQQALKIPRKQGTGESFLNDLLKGQDVKKYEIEAMGLDTYLKGKPNVTRQEVQDFIQNNKIDVQEKQLGGTITEDPLGIAKRKEVFDKYEPQIQAMYREMDNPTYKLVDRQVGPEEYQRGVILQNRVYRGEEITAQEQSELDSIMNRINGVAIKEFPNVEEARKYYLSMSSDDKFRHSIMPVNSSTELQDKINRLQNIRDAEADAAYVVPEASPTKYDRYQLAGGENYRELLLKLPEQTVTEPSWQVIKPDGTTTTGFFTTEEAARRDASYIGGTVRQAAPVNYTTGYRSSHFPDLNILAHMRVNDRIDAEGKKMLLIEEVQSDWHQAGREKGYKTKESLEKWYNQNKLDNDPAFAELNSEQRSVIERNRSAGMGGDNAVPDAPFKDTWYQLALKRAIKEAVDKGYDRIGLTTGKRQIERFSDELRQNVDQIEFSSGYPNKENTTISATKNGQITFEGNVLNGKFIDGAAKGKTIEEVLGKSIAKKIQSHEPSQGLGTIKGNDLTIGGEGMKKYYDEVYPNYLEKYGKKYGAKAGETTINVGKDRSLADMKSKPIGVAKGDYGWTLELGDGSYYGSFQSEEQALKKLPEYQKRFEGGGERVRYLDITPEMKKAVQKGQPLAAVEGMTGLLA